MRAQPRIAIVGGGITGVFAAYFLARLGARPTIIERGQVAGQASGRNPGGLNPLHGPGIPGPLGPLALRSLQLHLESWEEVGRLSGLDFGGRLVARILVAMDDRESATLAAREKLHNATPGFSAYWLSGPDLRRRAPQCSPDAAGGLWTEGNARVDPGTYTRAVAKAAVRLGARTVRAEARGLRSRGGRATGVMLDSEVLACDGVVIAPGPWTAGPSSWLGVTLPVSPVKGELLLAECPAGVPPAEITWGRYGAYQAGPDRLWLGGTEDRADFEASPTASARGEIIGGIDRLLPRLGPVRLMDQVAGLRPVTADGLPLVGIPSGWENVCVATGAGRKGMLLGSGLGLAASQLLMTGATDLPIEPCRLDRLDLR